MTWMLHELYVDRVVRVGSREYERFPLSDEHSGLINAIWDGLKPKVAGDESDWAVWGYVVAKLRKTHPAVNPHDVWMSLPSIPTGLSQYPAYGLAWHSGNPQSPPERGDTIGLTLAGVEALRSTFPREWSAAGTMRERSMMIVENIAEEAKRLRPRPRELPSKVFDLSRFLPPFDPGRFKRIKISLRGFAEMLAREPFLDVRIFEEDDTWKVSIDAGSLAHLSRLGEDYEYVEVFDGVEEVHIDTHDYFSLTSPYFERVPALNNGGQPLNQEDAVEGGIFIVHGHDEGAKHQVARVLRQLTGFEPTILHELPNGGLTIIEKFEQYGGKTDVAVVLLTPDDEGGVVGGELRYRARQNVVLELGYFAGLLGRRKVIALVKGEVEIPSDISGIVYIPLDSGSWQLKLGAELSHLGVPVDFRSVRS